MAKKKEITDEQRVYRGSILKNRVVPQKSRARPIPEEKPKLTFMEEKIMYLTNCIYWLREYSYGRESKEKLFYTLTAIEKHCAEIRSNIK